MIWLMRLRLHLANRRLVEAWIAEQKRETATVKDFCLAQHDTIEKQTLELAHLRERCEHFEASAARWRAAAERTLAMVQHPTIAAELADGLANTDKPAVDELDEIEADFRDE